MVLGLGKKIEGLARILKGALYKSPDKLNLSSIRPDKADYPSNAATITLI